jgi:ketosteroid isomerase-like protein
LSDEVDPRAEIAEHLYGAISAGDLDEAVRWAHPEIVLDWTRSRGPYKGMYEGHEGAREFVDEAITAFRDVEYFTDEWLTAGERLIRVGGIRAVGRSSGVEIEGHGAQIFEFADGLVKRVTLFQTKEEALAAAAAAN